MAFMIWVHGFMIMMGLILAAMIIADAIKKVHSVKENNHVKNDKG